jgi:serine/threonine protein kinase
MSQIFVLYKISKFVFHYQKNYQKMFLFQGKFTTKSDVWSFGVTLWEILTFAREQPYESLSDERVIANLSRLYETKGRPGNGVGLPTPFQCPREVRDLMNECWQRDESERPSFREIHLFLQRKNLGYDPSCDLESADVTLRDFCEDLTSATDGDDYDDIDADADDDLQ